MERCMNASSGLYRWDGLGGNRMSHEDCILQLEFSGTEVGKRIYNLDLQPSSNSVFADDSAGRSSLRQSLCNVRSL